MQYGPSDADILLFSKIIHGLFLLLFLMMVICGVVDYFKEGIISDSDPWWITMFFWAWAAVSNKEFLRAIMIID